MRGAARQRQRGAVTLVGVLFLVVVLIVLLSAVQRMAASGITGTALHNDGIEALFLAESGLERAAWRYATGSSCAALAGESDTAGRGEFEILSSALAGSFCRVRVEGRVVTTIAANTVRRTVEGDLDRAGFSAWAVGDQSGGSAVLLAWDGSTWTNVSAPAVPGRDLNGIHCFAGADCWAVGDTSGGSANINHWDGSTWSNISAPALPGRNLNSVYCVASDDCWAVGDRQSFFADNINHWDGSSWSIVPAPTFPGTNLNSVYCVTSDDCWAVGDRRFFSANIKHWDGSGWSNVPTPGVPARNLNSVHCVANDDCWAVGDRNGNAENLNHWNGSSWTPVTAPGIPNRDLTAVYCLASDDCRAVGDASGGENIVHWDGAAWTRAGPYGSVPNNELHGIAMVSATEGYAVGAGGTIAAWNGSSWIGQSSPVSSRLNAISVLGGPGGGGVRLVRWTEVIL